MGHVKTLALGFLATAIGVAVIFRVAPIRKIVTGMA